MNVLFIPHGPLLKDIKTRGEEIAYQLAKKYNVFYLNNEINYYGTVFSKIFFKIKEHFKKIEESQYKNFNVLTVPYSALYSLKGLRERQLSNFSRNYNTRVLKKIVKKKKIDIIINESFLLWDTSKVGIPYVYDLVDFNSSGKLSEFELAQIENAKGVFCVSHYIQKELMKLNIDSVVIPNGVSLDEFRCNKKEIRKDSKIYRLGFIGNHGWWSGLTFLLDVFKNLKGNYELYVVGGGSEVPKAKEKVYYEKIQNVIFTGPVPKKDVVKYYNLIDLGLLPFKKTILTDAAFPIKILEYTACKKFVLASNLEELKYLKLSNVVLCERNVEKWVKFIEKLKRDKWNSGWDKEIKKYEWSNVVKPLINAIEDLK